MDRARRSPGGTPPRVSVTLIARDEEDRLPDTLASVAFADEVVVVVDAASSDRTEEIARAFGARVLVRMFDGFGTQKNAAADLTTSPWILSVDADEVVSPELALEIRARLHELTRTPASPDAPVAFRVPICLEFLGRTLHFGRDTVVRPVRLYHRDRARFSPDAIHEKVLASGPVDSLDETMLHRSYRDLSHYLVKLDRYTTLAAEAKRAAGKERMPFLPLRVAWDFFDRAVLRLGFLDGTAGLTFAALSAGNTLLKYLKLRELETNAARDQAEEETARPAETLSLGAR